MTSLRRRIRTTGIAAVLALAATALAAPAAAAPASVSAGARGEATSSANAASVKDVRFATFNASLNRGAEGALVRDLSAPGNAQADAVAEIIQRVDPDVLLINEFDYDAEGEALRLFHDNYLAVPHGDAAPVEYPYRYAAPVNTGVPSGFDLSNDGTVGGGDDTWGFGLFPGQYGMAVYSKLPIDEEAIRTFQRFRWADMPDALLPDDPATPEPADWYSPEELARFPLSSKSHWDVPIRVAKNKTLHFLVSHPTPPTFDGAEDRNGRRNHDEIRFWADYITGGDAASYIVDDAGRSGGLKGGSLFVIAGDQNADPHDGDSTDGAIDQLLGHPRVNTGSVPTSPGGAEAAQRQGGVNLEHTGDPAEDTADFAEPPGNLRVDYVLPSRPLKILDAGVFWPASDDPLSRLTGSYPFPSSDHRLVWVDVDVPGVMR
ncbi:MULTISPECIES: endonuclease/exonuclease/phosphatase family protein [Microbacterium]|uniref:endonuclease/exonuclease/phosphatase family protein n=1 Tax=Microbacterium TaxID=33882 RepID=UPI00217D3413|nr:MULTISPECIES: endonuclease/exonuclease/phosphatase family protein [Microbacterium]UWF77234.1 endonuclease/exonuclease/phosphatase family protein [Microbacterium neungamense]WCM55389.1 endonuclease/exonuclease/phosphatase family protein [Microbacterium sp. EF45047]